MAGTRLVQALRVPALGIGLVVALGLAGCGGSAATGTPGDASVAAGSPGDAPAATAPVASGAPPATTPTPAPASSQSPQPGAPGSPGASAGPGPSEAPVTTAFTLTSTAFDAGGSIPKRHTCDGADVSPELAWAGAPDGTAALVLVVDDPDARRWVHWLVLDLPGAPIGSLPADISPSAAQPAQGTNDFGKPGWGGPCPPSGEHRYRFTLYALAAPLGLAGRPDGDRVRAALGIATVLGTTTLEGRYRRH